MFILFSVFYYVLYTCLYFPGKLIFLNNFQINISLKESSAEGNIVKDFLYHQGRSKIRDQLEKYIKDLKEGINI